ncbi:hypothetical protein K2P97_09430 [bacterium]|nr:hypothetical protein [bacterium]
MKLVKVTTLIIGFFSVMLSGCLESGGGSLSSVDVVPPTAPAPVAPPSGSAPEATVNPIQVFVSANRVTGVAPLAVFFDATATTAENVTKPFHDLEYDWDFGDTAAGNWTYGSNPGVSSKNKAKGALAGHVFENAGTYNVKLKVFDGVNTNEKIVSITVLDENTVFAGDKTICFSALGDFTGCPNGASQIVQNNFAVAVNTYLASGKRLLFKRNEVWTSSATANIDKNGPGIIGAFGSGNKPIINLVGNVRGITLSSSNTPDLSDWRIMDLEINGQGAPGATSSGVGGMGGMNNFTILRLSILNVGSGISLADSTLDFNNTSPSAVPGHDLWENVAIVDTSLYRMLNPSGGCGMFISAKKLMLLGNSIVDSTNAEHNFRSMFTYKSIIQHNYIAYPNSTKGVLTIRAPLYSPTTCTKVSGCGYNELILISDNKFRGGIGGITTNVGLVSPGGIDARVRDVIFERNFTVMGISDQQGLAVWVDNVTIRNNIFDMASDNVTSNGRAIVVGAQDGSEPLHKDIFIYNNSAYSRNNSTFRMIKISAGVENVDIQNNLAYAPFAATTAVLIENLGAINVTGSDGTLGNSSNHQIKNTSPSFLNASGNFAQASDFTPAANSYAKGNGYEIKIFSDFFGTARNRNPFDSGAILSE